MFDTKNLYSLFLYCTGGMVSIINKVINKKQITGAVLGDLGLVGLRGVQEQGHPRGHLGVFLNLVLSGLSCLCEDSTAFDGAER